MRKISSLWYLLGGVAWTAEMLEATDHLVIKGSDGLLGSDPWEAESSVEGCFVHQDWLETTQPGLSKLVISHKILNHQVCLLAMHQISNTLVHFSLQGEHNFGVALVLIQSVTGNVGRAFRTGGH